MVLITIDIEIQSSQEIKVSVNPVTVTPVKIASPAEAETTPVAPSVEAVSDFVTKLAPNPRAVVLAAVNQVKEAGPPIYRRQILKELGFSQDLQWQGINSAISRRWRAALGNPKANGLIQTRFEARVDDYRITFAADVSEEIIDRLAKELKAHHPE